MIKNLILILTFVCLFGEIGIAQGFIQNKGQFRNQYGDKVEDLLFIANLQGFSVQLYTDHFTYELKREDDPEILPGKRDELDFLENHPFKVHYSRVEFYFGSQINEIQAYDTIDFHSNYFFENDAYAGIKTCQKVVYSNVYNNIDLEFILNKNGFKYNFIIHPGGNIEDIKFDIKGGDLLWIKDNELNIQTANGNLIEQIPYSYSEKHPEINIETHYILENQRTLRFNIPETEFVSNRETLIIDPVPDIIWGTYAGGENGEYLEGVTYDVENNICVAGFTASTTNIATTGAYDGTFDGVFDIYLAQYNPDGVKIWATYFGGASYDRAYGITCSEDNYLYITGNTYSPGIATPGVHQTFQVNGDEAFVAKFDSNGFLQWSTYYGGDQHDFGAVIVVDDNNNTYITGHTYSSNYIATAGMYKETFTGLSNAYIAKFNDSGLLEWATYFGEQLEEGWGIGLDSNANVYMSGSTQATFGIASPGSHQELFAGYNDAFLTKFDTDGNYIWGTYYGGVSNDQSYDLVVNSAGDCYMAGITSCTSGIAYGNVYQPTPQSVDDGFLARFDTDGNLIWGTYIGGEGVDYVYGVDLGVDNNIVVCGMTTSLTGIANSNSFDNAWDGNYDAFFISIDDNGGWRFGSYYGGVLYDESRDVAVDPSDLRIVMVGNSESTSNISTPGAEVEIYPGGSNDTYVVKFCNPILPDLHVLDSTLVCENQAETLYVANYTAFPTFLWSTGEISDSIAIAGLTTGTYFYYADGIDTNGCVTVSDTLIINYFETGLPPTISTTPGSLCADDSVLCWTNSGFDSYSWMSGNTDTLFQYSNFPSGDSVAIYVIVTDSNGCELSSDTNWVGIWPLPDASIQLNSSAPFCIDDTLNVSVNPSSNYSWSNGDNQSSTFYSWSSVGTYSIWVQVISGNGCVSSDTSSILVEACDIGINEVVDHQLEIYPIPFQEYIIVRNNGYYDRMAVYAVNGQVVYVENNLTNDKEILVDLSFLESGVYTVKFENSSEFKMRRIVKR